jgi:hypothetical protein
MKFSLFNYVRLSAGMIVLGFAVLTGCISSTPDTLSTPTASVFLASSSEMPSQTLEIQSSKVQPPKSTDTSSAMPSVIADGCYAWVADASIPLNSIQQLWMDKQQRLGFCGEKYYIMSIAFGDGKWVATLDSHKNLGDQKILTNTAIPENDIEQDYADHYRITSIAYGNGLWAIVMSKTSPYSVQETKQYTAFPPNDIEDMRGNGYWVTSLAYGDGIWVVVYSKTDQISAQKLNTTPTFPDDYVKSAEVENMFLTSQAYGNAMWVITVSKLKDAIKKQGIVKLPVFSKDLIQQFWFESENNYINIKAFYGDKTWFVVAQEETP